MQKSSKAGLDVSFDRDLGELVDGVLVGDELHVYLRMGLFI